jgi:hypothetical protein
MRLVVTEQDNYDIDSMITNNNWLQDGLINELVEGKYHKALHLISGLYS